jgi:hypothetical protein
MRAFHAEPNSIKRDEIAARQLHVLKRHYAGKLRLFDVKAVNRPKPEQFTITRAKATVPECEAYRALAEQAVATARAISASVHGAKSVTEPPSS